MKLIAFEALQERMAHSACSRCVNPGLLVLAPWLSAQWRLSTEWFLPAGARCPPDATN